MEIEGLLKSQVQELGLEARKARFNTTDFVATEVDSDFAGYSPVPCIAYQPTGAYFAFARHYHGYAYSDELTDEGHAVGFRPGTSRPFENRGPLEWDEVLRAFREWLAAIRREEQVEDIWAIPGVSDVFESNNEDETFTPNERTAIGAQLDRIERELLQATAAQANSNSEIKKELEELRGELSKMKKGQWKRLAAGTLVSLGAKRLVTPEAMQKGWDLLQKAIESLPALPR